MQGGVEHASVAMVVCLIAVLGPVVYLIRRAKKNINNFHIRRIPGIDAIDDALGGSIERGRPISFSTGLTSVGPVLYACLGVLHYVSQRCAKAASQLLVPQNDPEAMAIVENTVREGYRSVGKVSNFAPQDVRFFSEDQFAFASGYIGMMHRENVGGAFLFGRFAAESLILAEAGQQVGAIQVAASATPEQVAFFICTCDYTLIGEELFAASAYLSKEPVQVGSLAGQDLGKLFLFIVVIIGILVATIRSLFPELGIPEELNTESILFYFSK